MQDTHPSTPNIQINKLDYAKYEIMFGYLLVNKQYITDKYDKQDIYILRKQLAMSLHILYNRLYVEVRSTSLILGRMLKKWIKLCGYSKFNQSLTIDLSFITF